MNSNSSPSGGGISERSGTSSSTLGGPRALRCRFQGGSQAPRDFKIRSITSSWCGEVSAESNRSRKSRSAKKIVGAKNTGLETADEPLSRIAPKRSGLIFRDPTSSRCSTEPKAEADCPRHHPQECPDSRSWAPTILQTEVEVVFDLELPVANEFILTVTSQRETVVRNRSRGMCDTPTCLNEAHADVSLVVGELYEFVKTPDLFEQFAPKSTRAPAHVVVPGSRGIVEVTWLGSDGNLPAT